MPYRLRSTLIASACLFCVPPILHAQEETGAQPSPGEVPEASSAEQGTRVFPPSYFAQFGPRNALEMVERLPGFQISGDGGGGGGGGGSGSRGLGQADQNVLVNGQRLTSKSETVRDQLGRIPADDVLRIEIVEGATLDLPGLTGQVANVITSTTGMSGVFQYEATFRDNGTSPEWFGGEISISGQGGPLSYSLSLENNNSRFGGPATTLIVGPEGEILEFARGERVGRYDYPQLRGNATYRFSPAVTASLNGYIGHTFFSERENEVRTLSDGTVFDRRNSRTGSTPDYELGTDVTFPIAPGSMKLIALEAYDAEENFNTLIDTPRDGSTATGRRFNRTGGSGERIARFEYSWPMLGAEWQLSGEAAFNRLDLESELFDLAPDGTFVEVPFPSGTGGVREARYESILSLTRQLSDRLSIQASVGGEQSTIETTGAQANSRTFRRPKGSVALAWQAGDGLDVSLSFERSVGQLSFSDFLASVSLDQDNENAGNAQLVPSQTWEAQLEVAKSLGPWGSTLLLVEQRWIDDYIDFVSLPGGGVARGNIDSARRTEVESNTTLNLDPMGIAGARLDIRLEMELGELLDPLTNEVRDFSGGRKHEAVISYRHDIPGTQWAYGAGYQYYNDRLSFRLDQSFDEFEGPEFFNVFIEHKDVFGLTVKADFRNINDGRRYFVRSVYDGPRNTSPLLFDEEREERIGRLVRLTVSGNF